ncbi:MARVEL domain-containing protein 3 isoform X2 [Cuculus canorus]|uniref:MARVEL domain-containing protein 3 isoform X2 n=1 Tax=Cuculus canorus TaxID=55661 RepID=UPI0023AB0FAD|nr:MARVEL domain-containing protein 3 isoform X2 [Cuculus canorus]
MAGTAAGEPRGGGAGRRAAAEPSGSRGRSGGMGRAAAALPEEPRGRSRCRYLRTVRGCCQLLEALLAALLLGCAAVSLGPPGGYTGVAELGSIHYYHYGGAYSGFDGADGERARRLDQSFHLQKLPVARAAVAGAGALLAVPCLLIAAGALRVPWRFPAWLLLECGLDVAIAAGLVPAVYYFFRCLLGVYGSSVCQERERLYGSKGYRGFSCSLHGAEIAVGLWGCLAALAYLLSAGLALRGFRIVRSLKQKPEQSYEL